MMLKYGFPPIVDEHAQVLILGSMPGEESLAQSQYYANRRNAFWFILGQMLGFDSNTDYQSRTEILRQNRVALWDVMQACQREGSLDSSIRDESIRVNDFEDLFIRAPGIHYVFFNGARAEKEFMKRVLPELAHIHKTIRYQRLVSTSPAMAMMTREQKLEEWQVVLQVLDKRTSD